MTDYRPLDLNPKSLHDLFIATIANPATISPIRCILFRKDKGFPEDSRPIFFDKQALEDVRAAIEYLLGQLKDTHEGKNSTATTSIATRYDDTTWVNSNQSILEILHMACAAGIIEPIDAKTSKANYIEDIYPTISPDDPNYKSWRKENKQKILQLGAEKQGREDK